MTAELETKVELMAKDITYIKESLEEIKSGIKAIDEKKAGVWVEKAIIGVVIFVFTAVGGALLALIFK